MQNRLVIFGCGGHARAVLDVVLFNGDYQDIVFVDDNARINEMIGGFPVVKNYEITDEAVFAAFGDNAKRVEIASEYYDSLVSVISKNAYIGKDVKIGKGVFVAHKAHIGVMSQVKDFSLINTSASIDHECVIEQGAFVAPNATLCGKVRLGEKSFIGAGGCVVDGVSVCSGVIVGAGGVVVKDIVMPGTYVGVPAKSIKSVIFGGGKVLVVFCQDKHPVRYCQERRAC